MQFSHTNGGASRAADTQGGYMNVPIKPLSGHVVLTQKEQSSTTKSGILLTDAAKEKTEARVVAAVAEDVETLRLAMK